MAEKKKSKIEKRYGFDKAFIGLMRFTAVPFLKLRYGVKTGSHDTLPAGPCVVLYNHVTDLDVAWVIDKFREQMYCVASEHIVRFPVAGKLLSIFFAPILIKKGTSGAGAVMEMSRHLRAGHKVLMAPEGVRSGNGLTNPIVPTTAAVLKKLKCPVVTVRIHGGYFTTPRWGRGVRKGLITLEKVGEYSAEEIAGMPSAAFLERIAGDLSEDAYAYNERLGDAKIAYRGKNPAEGIETQLYLCPQCRRLLTIRSKGNEFFCDCGLHGTINEYGILNGNNLPYSTIRDWDAWESKYIADLPKELDLLLRDKDSGMYSEEGILLQSPDITLSEISKEHKNAVLSEGKLVLTKDTLSVGDYVIPLSEIEEVSVIGYGILLLFSKDKHYFEFRGKERYPGIAYLNFIRKLKK
ncbi:MAG: 1-acyl-sn-glycerol-3-phosphate acyltransferase [Lachnospiraceae bacterium]|nr:1-acyl-sn-glycerol-3-phosphate acyltransferase [Lachnospiraceae bacterium]